MNETINANKLKIVQIQFFFKYLYFPVGIAQSDTLNKVGYDATLLLTLDSTLVGYV